ncbi:diacylglycerol/lipid kinase family protein [Streptomyces sp. CRN 30]|uniref:diacylglycerol/lipid kinase family protein n=1 Tax=Streptomyces sp. CRN 30 TaxID=3075613 RepID=UPI002A8162D3|nr:diacylglycerol kinase family protein [Streptomyces sp. CRN 30]
MPDERQAPAPAGPPVAARPRRALIVANPTAGTMAPGTLTEAAGLCRDRLAHVDVHTTRHRGDARDTVRAALRRPPAEAPDLVVAMGGDGTVGEVIAGMTDGHRPASAALAVVPAGTGNSGYRMVWGRLPWQDALRAALAAPSPDAVARRVDLALLVETGALVFLGACSGVIAEALETARGIPLTGPARYERALAETARAFSPYPGRVTVDGAVVHEGGTVFANVGGGRVRGGQYLVLPRSDPDDGLLDVCVFGSPAAATEVAGLTLTGAHLDRQGVVYARGRTVRVERLDGRPLRYEHDGELQPPGPTTMTLRVLPAMIPVRGTPIPEPVPAT